MIDQKVRHLRKKNKMQYTSTYALLVNCTPETCWISLTSVTLINKWISKRERVLKLVSCLQRPRQFWFKKKKKSLVDHSVLGPFICSWIWSWLQELFLARMGWWERCGLESPCHCPQFTLLWGTWYSFCFGERSIATLGCCFHSDPSTYLVPRLSPRGWLPDKCLLNWKISRT